MNAPKRKRRRLNECRLERKLVSLFDGPVRSSVSGERECYLLVV